MACTSNPSHSASSDPSAAAPACEEPLPATVDHGALQMTFIPGIEGGEQDPRPPGFLCWSVPAMQRDEVASRLASWGAPMAPRRLQPASEWLLVPARHPHRRGLGLATLPVPGHRVELSPALEALVLLDTAAAPGGRTAPSPSVSAWSLAVKLALELVAREQLVPVLRGDPESRHAFARWAAAITHPSDRERFGRLAAAMPPAAHALARAPRPEAVAWSPSRLLRAGLDATIDTLARRAIATTAAADGDPLTLDPAARRRVRHRPGPWEERFVEALAAEHPLIIPYGLAESRLVEELGRWSRPALGAGHDDVRLCLRLVPPERETSQTWRLEFHLHSAADPGRMVAAARIWSAGHAALRVGARAVRDPQEALLRDLAEAAHAYGRIGDSLDEAQPTHLELTPAEVWTFLSEAAPVLEQAGMGIMVPPELAATGAQRLRPRLRVSSADSAGPARRPDEATAFVGGVTAHLGPEALSDFRWEAAIGDQTLSAEAFRRLAADKQPLVRWRDRWVVLEPGVVGELRRLLGKRGTADMPATTALAALLGGTTQTPDGREAEVVAAPELASIIEKLRAQGFPPVRTPTTFTGKLRPYQRRGLRWLAGMADLGLGTCLADDMGLGKTIQLIALLLHHQRQHPDDPRPTLVICPTSVLGNWQREIERFAPVLPVVRHHGPERARSAAALAHGLEPHAVVLTTYALARRDAGLLAKVAWSHAAIDEAQNVKNPAAQQARAVRGLRAARRVALTGTPIENRLAELWSIFEFLNPGLLGPLDRFRRQVAIPIERYREPKATERLRRLTGPFLLRRLKSDPRVVRDLPDKLEMSVVCALTQEQAALYQAAIDHLMAQIEASQGMSRRGLILKLITQLKQICNHPAHFQRETGPLPHRSGKLDRLLEMLEEARDAGDRALLYTQYREMGALLVSAVGTALDVDVPFLHGGVPPRQRDAMVDRFQEDPAAPPVFVLSLKAGGTGLNLTAANRVFHFDRWWNPAVEDQATDRAHRIGQTQTVQVHKLVTLGTLEERIDRMLEEKRELAEAVVGAGETWLTEMSDDELRSLVALSREAVVEEDGDGGNRGGRGRRRGRDGAASRRGSRGRAGGGED
ncbi:MAG: DEAD/DEAH box helicase [Candidatus Eiseniibacteriota bacterium]|jgi:hypothetical protein